MSERGRRVGNLLFVVRSVVQTMDALAESECVRPDDRAWLADNAKWLRAAAAGVVAAGCACGMEGCDSIACHQAHAAGEEVTG